MDTGSQETEGGGLFLFQSRDGWQLALLAHRVISGPFVVLVLVFFFFSFIFISWRLITL